MEQHQPRRHHLVQEPEVIDFISHTVQLSIIILLLYVQQSVPVNVLQKPVPLNNYNSSRTAVHSRGSTENTRHLHVIL